MILGHIGAVPVEELLALAPAVSGALLALRMSLSRHGRQTRRRTF